jgi:hypothetical protein
MLAPAIPKALSPEFETNARNRVRLDHCDILCDPL